MKTFQAMAVALAIGLSAVAASAQTAAEHAQHHPDGAAPAAVQAPAATPEQQLSAMDKQLQRMREMSRKMADAKTPQERQALMAEHHKTMQDSMKMMGQMQGMPPAGMGMMGMMANGAGTPGKTATSPSPAMGQQMMGGMMQRHAMMEKRMEMMESMMQMMMERLPADAASPGATK